jgi:hypothetical protein
LAVRAACRNPSRVLHCNLEEIVDGRDEFGSREWFLQVTNLVEREVLQDPHFFAVSGNEDNGQGRDLIAEAFGQINSSEFGHADVSDKKMVVVARKGRGCKSFCVNDLHC